jgi:Fe-S cluster biogenesis protein NfuA
MSEPQNLRAVGDRLEQLFEVLQAEADPRSRELAEELVRLVTELYGAGLERVVELARDEAPTFVASLANDELIASLLVVHGLHPDDVATRVGRALDSVRPFLATHGGDVELLEIDEEAGAVQLRLLGSCDGCPSSAITLQMAVERAIVEAAPEIMRIDVADTATPALGVDIPISLTGKPATRYDPATACGAIGSDAQEVALR